MTKRRRRNYAPVLKKPDKALRVAICIDTREEPERARLRGCYQYAMERNWQLYLLRKDRKAELDQVKALKLDGAILFNRSRRFQKAVKNKGVVCVETGLRHPDLADASVSVDYAELVRMVTEHLRAAGFEHLGFCGVARSSLSKKQVSLFMERTSGAGHVFEDLWWEGEMEIKPLLGWLEGLPKPVGIMANDDKMGERILTVCRWAGIRVPDEVGVIGIGNDELICEMTQPRLSSIVLPAQKVGWMAAEMLERLLSGKKRGPRNVALAPLEVIGRASTDWLPPARPAVLRAVEFMRMKSHQPIGIDQVADAVGVPRRTLVRIFAEDLEQTVHDYLVDLRMKNAKRLLRQTDLPLVEVAQKNGYLSLSSFVRMFELHTGEVPREYRRQYRQQHGRMGAG